MDVTRIVLTCWLPVGLYLALIFVLSSIPGFSVPGTFIYKDKIAHFFEYAGFSWLVHRAARATWPGRPRLRRAVLALFAIALFGVADEVFQAGTPGRDSSIYDWMADTLGASVAQAWGLATERRQGPA